jgi:hypothetical protein
MHLIRSKSSRIGWYTFAINLGINVLRRAQKKASADHTRSVRLNLSWCSLRSANAGVQITVGRSEGAKIFIISAAMHDRERERDLMAAAAAAAAAAAGCGPRGPDPPMNDLGAAQEAVAGVMSGCAPHRN